MRPRLLVEQTPILVPVRKLLLVMVTVAPFVIELEISRHIPLYSEKSR